MSEFVDASLLKFTEGGAAAGVEVEVVFVVHHQDQVKLLESVEDVPYPMLM